MTSSSIQRNLLFISVSTLYSTARITSTAKPLPGSGRGIPKKRFRETDLAGEQDAVETIAHELNLIGLF